MTFQKIWDACRLKKFILLGTLVIPLVPLGLGGSWASGQGPLTIAQSLPRPTKNSHDSSLQETMESMGEIELYFLGIKRKFVGSPSPKEVHRYKKEMMNNLNEWNRLASQLPDHPHASTKEKTKLWNEYVNSVAKELDFMKSSLNEENWENLWLHFDRLLDIEQKSHKELRPGLLKSLKRFFKISKN